MYLQVCRKSLSEALLKAKVEPPRPLGSADEHIASSVLQKSLRRGDLPYALGAAATLAAKDPARLWRRLTAIVCEDFGLSNLKLTAMVTAAASDSRWREEVGGDFAVATLLIRQLTSSPRDRRVDELYMWAGVIARTPNPEIFLASLNISSGLALVVRRAVRTVLQCEHVVNSAGQTALIGRECDFELARTCNRGWIDTDLYLALVQARRTSKTILPVLLPIALERSRACEPQLQENSHPPTLEVGCVPSYALDGYTRPGRAALTELAVRTPNLRCLLRGLRGAKPMQALTCLIFEAEGGICTQEISDPLSQELRTRSLGCWSGLGPSVFEEGLSLMRGLIPTLNDLRRVHFKGA
jgi:hypothetical protein